MPLFSKTKEDLVSEVLTKLNQNTNITQMTPGGKARFFLETTSKEQTDQMALFDLNLLQPYLQYADGRYLDFFGDMLNLPRLESTHAETTSDNFMFYVASGTFGDLNAGATFIIPAGRIVTTVPFDGVTVTPGLEEQPVIRYRTTVPVECDPSASFAYCNIRADLEGKLSSVPRNTINKHNVEGFPEGSLKCTNNFSIDNGDERESDTSYRYRLLQVFRSKEKGTRAALRLAALSVPGVSDILMVNFEQGPATFSIYVKGLTAVPSPQLLSNVSESVNRVTSEGVRPYVLAPVVIGMEFVIGVNWQAKTGVETKTRQYAAMRDAMESYLISLEIGEPEDLDDLIPVLTSAAPNVMSIGKIKPNKFEEVFIYRSSPYNVGAVRSKMIGETVEPLYNERIVLETSNSYRGIQFI